MLILITGANGFLGHYLTASLLAKGHHILATGLGNCRLPFSSEPGFQYLSLDFTDPFQVHDLFEKYQPAIVVHAGAMTRVDECEQNQWQAYLTNVEGTVTMLLNAGEHKSSFIFVSTDFVFDGVKGTYREGDELNPVNFYGRTKKEAEDAVEEYEFDWAIVRTSLVYGQPQPGKTNILAVVRDKLEKKEVYSVVNDQIRTPTYAGDLAAGIVSIIEKKATGIYHLAGMEEWTPYQMACSVARYFNLDASLLKMVTAADFSQPALRPARTNLVIDKAREALDYRPVSFEEGLKLTYPKI